MIPDLPPESWALLPLGAAVGLDLHLLVLFLGMAPLLGWDAPAPGGLGGLSYPPALAMAGLLYVVEGTVERFPTGSLFWNAIQLLVRPLAAALLALLLLEEAPLGWSLAGGAVAAALALAMQWARSGWRLLLEFMEARVSTRLVASGAEDAMALALAALVLDRPAGGALLTVLLLVLAGLSARPYLEAFTFGLHLLRSRTLGLLDRSQWHPLTTMSARARRALSPGPEDGAAGTVRVTPVGAVRPGTGGMFRRGWLVQAGGALRFVTRGGRAGEVLEGGAEADRRHFDSSRSLYHRVGFRSGEGATLLLLPRGGPDPSEVVGSGRPRGPSPPSKTG